MGGRLTTGFWSLFKLITKMFQRNLLQSKFSIGVEVSSKVTAKSNYCGFIGLRNAHILTFISILILTGAQTAYAHKQGSLEKFNVIIVDLYREPIRKAKKPRL